LGTEKCTLCPRNKYCEKDGVIAATIVTMPNGYNAVDGAPIRGPNQYKDHATDPSTQWHLCSKGYFCDTANDNLASREVVCPVGKFMPTEGAKTLADCLPCNGGFTCGPTAGVITPVACASGHYCPNETTTTVVGAAGASPVVPV
jgi:hypothetical protein